MSVKKITAALMPTTALLVLLVPAEAYAAGPGAGVPRAACALPAVKALPKPSCVNGWQ
ncbi:hypothetical protein ABT143_01010 [Streptomyces sp. NPDC002033]|uniref:hypothetical protein n=1 Tax=unclassified Streptomyces TaxID=2593676 RepID=UPI00333321A2